MAPKTAANAGDAVTPAEDGQSSPRKEQTSPEAGGLSEEQRPGEDGVSRGEDLASFISSKKEPSLAALQFPKRKPVVRPRGRGEFHLLPVDVKVTF